MGGIEMIENKFNYHIKDSYRKDKYPEDYEDECEEDLK